MAFLVNTGKVKQLVDSTDSEMPKVGRADLGFVLANQWAVNIVTSAHHVSSTDSGPQWDTLVGSLQPLT